MNLLSNALAFLFAVGFIVFFHELGHYIVGRLFGVRVLTFSLGFGRRIWGFRRGETEYRVAAIPLGGYVAFAGHDPGSLSSHASDFLNRPRWQRVLVLLAGPAMNIFLAVGLIAMVFMLGTEVPNPRDLPAVIGAVAEDSPAAEAGLERGDRVLRLDDVEVSHWQELSLTIAMSPGEEMPLRFERGGEVIDSVLTPATIPHQELGEAGIFPDLPLRVYSVERGTPADRAGFRYGDALRAVNGRPVGTPQEFQDLVGPLAGQLVTIEVERRDERFAVEVTPEDREGRGVVGFIIAQFHYARLGPVEAVRQSVRYNVETTGEIFSFLGKMFEREISPQSALSGPIEIARVSGSAARRSFKDLLFLMGLISLNLCVLNLLPIPLLDGGQIMILLIESVIRRDLSLRLKEGVMQVGLVLIVALMAMAIYFDLVKNVPPLFERSTEEAPTEQVEPEAAPIDGDAAPAEP